MRGMCADDPILYDSIREAKQARQRVVGPCLLVNSNKENHMIRPVQTLRRRALGTLSFAIALAALSGCGGGGGGSDINTLYDAYKALTPGMTKAEVLDLVPFKSSQGASTSQVLWVEGQEALGVRFNSSSSTGVITFAQWGMSIPAGGQNESRNF